MLYCNGSRQSTNIHENVLYFFSLPSVNEHLAFFDNSNTMHTCLPYHPLVLFFCAFPHKYIYMSIQLEYHLGVVCAEHFFFVRTHHCVRQVLRSNKKIKKPPTNQQISSVFEPDQVSNLSKRYRPNSSSNRFANFIQNLECVSIELCGG